MLFLEKVELAVQICLWSGYVKGERPINLILIAEPEHGKTEVIQKYAELNYPGVMVQNDMTVSGIRNSLVEIKEGRTRHIAILDFIKVLNRSKSAADNFVTMLNSLIEEGILSVNIYGFNFKSEFPVRCGLITSATPWLYRSRKSKWIGMGFISRCIPMSWSYSDLQAQKIRDYIKKGIYCCDKPVKIRFPKKSVDVEIDENYMNQVESISRTLGIQTFTHGFRYLKHLRVMLKAHALMTAKTKTKVKVSQKDVDAVLGIASWFNLKGNVIE